MEDLEVTRQSCKVLLPTSIVIATNHFFFSCDYLSIQLFCFSNLIAR